MTRTHPTGRFELPPRQYAAHRADVLRLLRGRFGSALNESDREDLYQEAWAGVLEFRRRGRTAPDVAGLLKTIAFRRALDRLRNRRAEPTDPIDGPLSLALDRRPTPDEHAEVSADAEVCRQIIDALSDRQKQVLKLRYEWQFSPRETQEALRLSKKGYEKQLTRALKRVAVAVAEVKSGGWRKEQLSLLLACESGTATEVERARARRLVARDPTCRAMLRQIRRVAALAPVPILLRCHLASVVRSSWARAVGLRLPVRRPLLALRHGPLATNAAIGASATTLKVAALAAASLVVAGGTTIAVVDRGHATSRPPALPTAAFNAGALAARAEARQASRETPPEPIAPPGRPRARPRPRPVAVAAPRAAAPTAGTAGSPAQPIGRALPAPPVLATPVRPESDTSAHPVAPPPHGNGIAEFGP